MSVRLNLRYRPWSWARAQSGVSGPAPLNTCATAAGLGLTKRCGGSDTPPSVGPPDGSAAVALSLNGGSVEDPIPV